MASGVFKLECWKTHFSQFFSETVLKYDSEIFQLSFLVWQSYFKPTMQPFDQKKQLAVSTLDASI